MRTLFFRILYFSILFISIEVFSNDTIKINNNQYFTDNNKLLILSNLDTNTINSTWQNSKTHILMNELYEFQNSENTIRIGTPYTVYSASQNVYYTLYFTELPIISISTPNVIVDEPDVWGYFKMIEKNQNYLESNIGIQYRGASSQAYPKKSMEFEFWNDTLGTESEDHSLLNMVNTDSWNLQAMYNEPLRIRSKTNNDLWRMINNLHYQSEEPEAINGIRMNYVELFMNNSYHGVYCLGEKVNRKQLKLKKHNGNIKGELYKGVSWGASTFTSLPPFNNNIDVWGGFEYKHPKEETDWQNIYNLVDFVINTSDSTFYDNYSSKFDVDNLVDYYIFLNLLRATDNTGKNVYIAKYNSNSKYFYVPWDLDGTFGIIWDGSNEAITNDLLTNGLYNRLINDCRPGGFREKLKAKWQALRQNTITHTSLMNMFNINHNLLNSNGIYQRESLVWSDFVYNNSALNYMSNWISNRLTYLDDQFLQNCPSLLIEEVAKTDKSFKVYPNPTSEKVFIDSNSGNKFSVDVYNNLGQLVLSDTSKDSKKEINLSNFSNGTYLFKITDNKQVETHKVILSK